MKETNFQDEIFKTRLAISLAIMLPVRVCREGSANLIYYAPAARLRGFIDAAHEKFCDWRHMLAPT